MRTNVNFNITGFLTLIIICGIAWYCYSEYKASQAREQARLVAQAKEDEEATRRLEEYRAQQAEEQHSKDLELERLKIEAQERARRTHEEDASRARLAEQERQRQTEEAQRAEEERRRIEEENRLKLAEAAMREDAAKRQGAIDTALQKFRDSAKKLREAESRRYDAYKTFVAYRNRLTGAQKDAAVLTKEIEKNRYLDANSASLVVGAEDLQIEMKWDYSDQINRARQRRMFSEAEIIRMQEGFNRAKTEFDAANKEVASAARAVEVARGKLKDLDALHLLANNLRDAISIKIYTLKDGKQVRALTAMETDDKVSLKTVSGEILSVEKSQIESVVEENTQFPDASIQVPGLNQAPKPKLPTYVLKDGKEIRALKVVDGDDVWSVKDENGKYVVIKKSDVVRIDNPEAGKQ